MLPKYLQKSGQDIRIDVLLLLPDMGDCISYISKRIQLHQSQTNIYPRHWRWQTGFYHGQHNVPSSRISAIQHHHRTIYGRC